MAGNGDLEDLRSLVDKLTRDLISIDAPDWYLNPDYSILLAESEEIFRATPLRFANGLLDVLQAESPPSYEYFLTLKAPKRGRKYWCVYVVVLMKDGHPPVLYIGSGTNAASGCSSRLSQYADKKHRDLPRFWTSSRARMRFIAVEALFTNVFRTAFKSIMDALWVSRLPWPDCSDERDYIPANSHTALMEGCVSDLALSAEELVIQNERRRVRRARMHAASNKARYESERRRDINAWRAMENRKARAYIKANRSAARARGRRSKHKAIKDRRFLCVDCDEPNGSLHNLQRHQNGRPHRDQVAINAGELTAKAPTEKAVYQRDRIAAAKANKTYYCGVCRHNPGKPESLAGHKKSMKHNRRMKEAGLEPDYPEVLENDE